MVPETTGTRNRLTTGPAISMSSATNSATRQPRNEPSLFCAAGSPSSISTLHPKPANSSTGDPNLRPGLVLGSEVKDVVETGQIFGGHLSRDPTPRTHQPFGKSPGANRGRSTQIEGDNIGGEPSTITDGHTVRPSPSSDHRRPCQIYLDYWRRDSPAIRKTKAFRFRPTANVSRCPRIVHGSFHLMQSTGNSLLSTSLGAQRPKNSGSVGDDIDINERFRRQRPIR